MTNFEKARENAFRRTGIKFVNDKPFCFTAVFNESYQAQEFYFDTVDSFRLDAYCKGNRVSVYDD